MGRLCQESARIHRRLAQTPPKSLLNLIVAEQIMAQPKRIARRAHHSFVARCPHRRRAFPGGADTAAPASSAQHRRRTLVARLAKVEYRGARTVPASNSLRRRWIIWLAISARSPPSPFATTGCAPIAATPPQLAPRLVAPGVVTQALTNGRPLKVTRSVVNYPLPKRFALVYKRFCVVLPLLIS